MAETHDVYIVVFKEQTGDEVVADYLKKTEDYGGTILKQFSLVFNGFSAQLPPQAVALFQDEIKTTSNTPIKYIEKDQEVSICGV